MALTRLVRPLGAAAALTLALALTGVAGLPVAAADGGTDLSFEGPSAVSLDTAPDSQGTAGLDLSLRKSGPGQPQGLEVAYDTRDLAGVADLAVGCPAADTVYRCEQQTVNGTAGLAGFPRLTVAKDAAAGAKGVLHITVTGTDVKEVSTDVDVYVGGPALTPVASFDPVTVEPGGVAGRGLEITNKGEQPAQRVVLEITVGKGLKPAGSFGNCEQGEPRAGTDLTPGVLGMICTIDSPIAPGETVKLDPVPFKAGSTEYEPLVEYRVLANREGDGLMRQQYDLKPGKGARLTLGTPEVPVTDPGGPNVTLPAGPYYSFTMRFAVGLGTDHAALGRWTPQGDGRSGTLRVGVRNNGPADNAYHQLDQGEAVRVVLPAGVRLPVPPTGCYDMANDAVQVLGGGWTCRVDMSRVGKVGGEQSFDFALELDDPAQGPAAEVSLQNRTSTYERGHASAVTDWDHNPRNDIVTVRLGADPSDGTPNGNPAQDAPASAAPAPGEPSHSAPASSGGGGFPTWPLWAVALGAGLAVLVLRRRRAGARR
ncbi:hypothetical protein ACFQ6N_07320 [Kitasatospora sp. NPDC056446]|uniref:hypothetical protein n=1 Tax=Kitasatospora sp. NPDC056446 TaxID=3345819 RepID=UPI0036836075